MEWERDFGISGEFGQDYILKVIPSIERSTEIWRQWNKRMETEKREGKKKQTSKKFGI